MEGYSLDNRLNAFIFIENEFIQNDTHTDCVICFLINKKLILNEKRFFKMLKHKHKKIILNNWLKQIEDNSVFGEIAIFDNKISLIVFDDLSRFGLEALKLKAFEKFGDIPILYAKYDKNSSQNFNIIFLN